MTVYVLSTDGSGAYKIGHTVQWERRLRSYEDHAYRVVVHFLDHTAGPEREQELHTLFWDKIAPRDDARSEWFMLQEADMALLQELLRDSRAEAAAQVRASAEVANAVFDRKGGG